MWWRPRRRPSGLVNREILPQRGTPKARCDSEVSSPVHSNGDERPGAEHQRAQFPTAPFRPRAGGFDQIVFDKRRAHALGVGRTVNLAGYRRARLDQSSRHLPRVLGAPGRCAAGQGKCKRANNV